MSANTSPRSIPPSPGFYQANQANQPYSPSSQSYQVSPPRNYQRDLSQIIASVLEGARRDEAALQNSQNPLQRELAQLHQTKTYVSIFKVNYKTKPDLAIAAFEVVREYLRSGAMQELQDPQYYSWSNFLYRDQVIKLGLARADMYLSANMIYEDYTDRNDVDYQYELYQLALSNPEYRQNLLDYFAEFGQDNWLYKALTGTNPAITQLLNNQIPANFWTQPDLINFALTFHLDWVWSQLTPEEAYRFQTARIQAQLWPKQIEQLNLRLAQKTDTTAAVKLMGVKLFNDWVWAAWELLSKGTAAYSALVRQWLQDANRNGTDSAVLGARVLNYLVKFVYDNGLKFTSQQWSQIVQAVLSGYQPETFFNSVNLSVKAILAMLYSGLKIDLGRSLLLADGLKANDDLTVIMADFVLTSQDLAQAGLNSGGTNDGRLRNQAELAILLPWYQGSREVLEVFLNQSLRNPFQGENGILQVSPFVYLAGVANNINLPQTNYRVVPLRAEEAPVVAFWLRKNWPLKVPNVVIDPNTAAALTRSLLVGQSIVEQYFG